MRNIDKIKSMNLYDMAKFLKEAFQDESVDDPECTLCKYYKDVIGCDSNGNSCQEGYMEWLKEEWK